MHQTAPVQRSFSKTFLSASVLVLASVLTACGGGSSGGGGGGPIVVGPPPPPPPPPNSPPRLTGNLSPVFVENEIASFFLDVEDADGDTVTVTVGNSADGQFFTLNTGNGEIRSTQEFDFESPQDVDGNNSYVQAVTLNDGTTTVTETVVVNIVNQDEPPMCDPAVDAELDENTTGLLATITGTDPDAGDDDNAVVENLSVSDVRVQDFISVNSTTGQVSINTALDAEAFEMDFSFDISADYRTSSLSDTCSFTVFLKDLPTRVTSGIKFDTNRRKGEALPDFNGDGLGEFWLAENKDSFGGNPVQAKMIFGQSLVDKADSELDLNTLTDAERITFTMPFPTGSGEAQAVTVKPISDVDGDGTTDLFIGTDNPPNQGFGAPRQPWAYIVFGKTIAANTSGEINVSNLTANDALSLTGPIDSNGSVASYVIWDLDGIAGDEIAISVPQSFQLGGEEGVLYIISGASILAANGNYDFDLDATTKKFTSPIDIDAELVVSNIEKIGDLDGDGADELLTFGVNLAVILPSQNIKATPSGEISTLDPLLLDLEGERSLALGQADVDGDALSDLLIVRGDGSVGRQGTIVFGDALTPIVSSDSKVAVNPTNFNTGDYIDLSSSGTGEGSEPIRLGGVGDLDGDGKDEVAFSVRLNNNNQDQGSIYILRGSALAEQPLFNITVDDFNAEKGTRIGTVPFLFQYISTKLTRTPDTDGDGIQDFYVISNRVEQVNPEGVGLLIKSSDVVAALNANQTDVDLEALFFNETPPQP